MLNTAPCHAAARLTGAKAAPRAAPVGCSPCTYSRPRFAPLLAAPYGRPLVRARSGCQPLASVDSYRGALRAPPSFTTQQGTRKRVCFQNFSSLQNFELTKENYAPKAQKIRVPKND